MQETNPISEADKVDLRIQLVPSILALSNPRDKAMRAQVTETVQLIAELDFPDRWSHLIEVYVTEQKKSTRYLTDIQQLIGSLSQSDYNINVAVLETAHSIFQPWRAHVRSNELFAEINLVFSSFMVPFLGIMRHTASLLLGGGSGQAESQAMVLLMDIFYDFVCQDLPPALEDAHDEFFAPDTGLFLRFLDWDPPALRNDVSIPALRGSSRLNHLPAR